MITKCLHASPLSFQACVKTVYAMDPQINLDGSIFHKQCAKCRDCNCQITLSNFNKNVAGEDTFLLCKTHFFQRFNEVTHQTIRCSSFFCHLGGSHSINNFSNAVRVLELDKFLDTIFSAILTCIAILTRNFGIFSVLPS